MEPSATSTTVGESLQASTEDAHVLGCPASLRRLHDYGAGNKYTDLLAFVAWTRPKLWRTNALWIVVVLVVVTIVTIVVVVVVKAVSDGSVYNGKPLSMAWQTADGVLSPKIIVPPRSSEPQMRSMPTSKSQSHSSGSSSTADESQSRKTSISKLLEVCLHLHPFILCTFRI